MCELASAARGSQDAGSRNRYPQYYKVSCHRTHVHSYSILECLDIPSRFMTRLFFQVWLLHRENGTRKCIVTTSEADSNWLRAAEPAESAADANCLAVSMKDELYLVTRADVCAGAPLSYFAKEDPTTEFWTCWTQAWANQRNCSRCSVHGQFETVADYRVHISLWHDMSFQGNPQNRIYYCPDCNAKRIGAKDIVHHCRERHGSLPFQCRGCSKRFETYNSLVKHKKRLHAEEKPLKKACDRCDKVYLDPKALKQHVKQV